MGLFHSDLIVSTLSSYYTQTFGVVDVHDVSRYYGDEGPVGAVVLSLATVSQHIHADSMSSLG